MAPDYCLVDAKIKEPFLISFGGGCVNDTIVHLSEPSMGFGGVGHSGMGCYHGLKSFETFSTRNSFSRNTIGLIYPCDINLIKPFI